MGLAARVIARDAPGDVAARIRFIATLARALHRVGVPAHRLERALSAVSARLGLQGQFFSTPTSVFASIGELGEQRTILVRADPGDVDLSRLEAVDEVAEQLMRGDLDVDAAVDRLRQIEERPPLHGPGVVTAAFAVTSGGAALIFGGGWGEAAVAALLGLEAGLLALVAGRLPQTARLLEPVAAAVTAAGATTAAWAWGLSSQIVMLSALIVLVPGLTLTQAITELASRHLSSGTARLAGAGSTLMLIGFGVALGGRVDVLLPGAAHPPVDPAPPPWVWWVALAVAPVAIAVLFQARVRQLPWILVVAGLGFVGARVGGALLGPALGAFVGAALLGTAANLYARWRRRPAIALLVPGIILLVPGSMGFRSVTALLADDAVAGIGAAFSALLVAVSLAAGLLLANAALPPRREL